MMGDQQTRLHFSTEKVIHRIVSTMTHDQGSQSTQIVTRSEILDYLVQKPIAFEAVVG